MFTGAESEAVEPQMQTDGSRTAEEITTPRHLSTSAFAEVAATVTGS